MRRGCWPNCATGAAAALAGALRLAPCAPPFPPCVGSLGIPAGRMPNPPSQFLHVIVHTQHTTSHSSQTRPAASSASCRPTTAGLPAPPSPCRHTHCCASTDPLPCAAPRSYSAYAPPWWAAPSRAPAAGAGSGAAATAAGTATARAALAGAPPAMILMQSMSPSAWIARQS